MGGMVTVNEEPLPWRAGMTVADVLASRGFVFPLLVVHVDGKLVDRGRYGHTKVQEGASVTVVHLMSGG